MSDFEQTLQCLDAILKSENPDKIFSHLTYHANKFGMDYVTVSRLTPDPLIESQNSYFKSTAPQAWIEIYNEKKYFLIDPVPPYVRQNSTAFVQEDAHKNLRKDQKDFIRHAQDYNINHAFIVPIHHPDHHASCVIYTSILPFTLAPKAALSLEMVARIAFQRMTMKHTPTKVKGDVSITTKERQILEFVSQGKTNWEIGKILEISEYSVRDYLSSLSKRFETSNRTHTVTRALQLGLITL